MKKFILSGALLMFAFTFSLAQQQQINAGMGLAYGTEVEQAGIIINGQYFFTDKWAGAPSLIFYFPEKEKFTSTGFSYEAKASVWEFNADVNYYFYSSGIAKFFGEGGLNVTSIKAKVKTTGGGSNQSSSESESRVGLNLGAGVDFIAGAKLIPFVALKYTVSDYDQLVIKGGVRFIIK